MFFPSRDGFFTLNFYFIKACEIYGIEAGGLRAFNCNQGGGGAYKPTDDRPGALYLVVTDHTNLEEFKESWYELKATIGKNTLRMRNETKFDKGEDKYSMGEDKYSKGEDKIWRGEDKKSKGEDKRSKGEDKRSNGEDKYSMNEDAFLTGNSAHAKRTSAWDKRTDKYSRGEAKR